MNCTGIPSINYSEFSSSIFDKAGSKRIPIGISLEATGTCNVSCIHCYMPNVNKKNELGISEIKRILDEAADMGSLWLLITGGEPLFREDFEEIYVYAKRKGFIITLFTNGTLINDRIADMLSTYQPFMAEVTVHSMNADIFDAITRVRGSFGRCINGVVKLKERNISLRLKTIAMRQNRDEIGGVMRFAEEIGADYRFDPHIQPKIDRGREPLDVRLSVKEVVDLDLQYGRITRDWKPAFDKFGRDAIPNPNYVYTCLAGVSGAYINSEGRLSACVSTQHEYYDLRSGNFKEAWSEFLPKVITKKPKTKYKCTSCQIKVLCGCCVGMSYLENGDEEAVVDYLCELGFLRQHLLDEHALIEGMS